MFDTLSLKTYQLDFCQGCFDEVCSRCSTRRDGVNTSEEVRIDGKPVCHDKPVGARAAPLGSRGTTVETLALEPGYFRTSNESHKVISCYQKNACRGGSDAGKYCASGYTGPCEMGLELGFVIELTLSGCCTYRTPRTQVGLSLVSVLIYTYASRIQFLD